MAPNVPHYELFARRLMTQNIWGEKKGDNHLHRQGRSKNQTKVAPNILLSPPVEWLQNFVIPPEIWNGDFQTPLTHP